MRYCKENQLNVYGTEVNYKLVQVAKQKGYNVICTDNLKSFEDKKIDLIVAFDVLEHIEQDKILDYLKEIKRVLKINGYFLARFPNGDSPIGLACQNGDITHHTILGTGKIEYFIKNIDVELIYIGAEAIANIISINPINTIKSIIVLCCKKIINSVYTIIYSRQNYSSPNLVMIFKKYN